MYMMFCVYVLNVNEGFGIMKGAKLPCARPRSSNGWMGKGNQSSTDVCVPVVLRVQRSAAQKLRCYCGQL